MKRLKTTDVDLHHADRRCSAGIDQSFDTDVGLISGNRIGLVCNPASIDASCIRRIVFRDDAESTLVALFGRGHGLSVQPAGTHYRNAARSRCAARGARLFALQRDARTTAEMLKDIDVLVVDLQDVGTRVYTYVYTMANCMRAAARHGVRVVVCDCPNPIGGEAVEGGCAARAVDVVRWQFLIPLCMERRSRAGASLQRCLRDRVRSRLVVPLAGWRRSMYFIRRGFRATRCPICRHSTRRLCIRAQ